MDQILVYLNVALKYLQTYTFNIIINICLVCAVIFAFSMIVRSIHDRQVFNEFFNISDDGIFSRRKIVESNIEKKNVLRFGMLDSLYVQIFYFLNDRDKGDKSDSVFYAAVTSGLVMGISLFSTGQRLLGVLIAPIFFMLVTKILSMLKINKIDKLKDEIPVAIDNIIRVMSKHSSLKTILYEASASLPEPMNTVLRTLSLKMSSDSGENVLTDFMDDYNDIWIYSFAFTLMSYLEDSPKADVINNLKELRDIIEKDVNERKAEALEKKMTVSINYVLVVIAIVGEFANIAMNPGGPAFFFKSPGGLACFLIGNTLLAASIISNILLTKK